MKKIISLLLILVCVTSIFSGCERYDLPPVDEIELESFTGIAKGKIRNGKLSVNVDEEFIDTLGKTVTVIINEEKFHSDNICSGDKVIVKIDSIEGTNKFTIKASSIILDEPIKYYKPVIYLYPEEDTLCSVKVDLDGKLTCTYPDHGNDGWQDFVAHPDGTLIFPDGKEYYCLYWEGVANMTPDFSKGFCVKGEDTAEFLSDILLEIGLTAREANEFIIYWLPLLQKNEYNLISFQRDSYTDTADLIINPEPDSLLRVYMVSKPLDSYTEIEPQVFDGFVRDGFTVVEWGGSIIQ